MDLINKSTCCLNQYLYSVFLYEFTFTIGE